MAKFKLISLVCNQETETDSDKKYSGLMSSLIELDGFTELKIIYDFEVVSLNLQTGEEVDAQRLAVVLEYINKLNNI